MPRVSWACTSVERAPTSRAMATARRAVSRWSRVASPSMPSQAQRLRVSASTADGPRPSSSRSACLTSSVTGAPLL